MRARGSLCSFFFFLFSLLISSSGICNATWLFISVLRERCRKKKVTCTAGTVNHTFVLFLLFLMRNAAFHPLISFRVLVLWFYLASELVSKKEMWRYVRLGFLDRPPFWGEQMHLYEK
ncbi:hypothetical protein F4810DRAFT_89450 [Camillea tinctor]|nr:hypothetical protein F4810DRAFT_89450 [Camillea tinctor]